MNEGLTGARVMTARLRATRDERPTARVSANDAHTVAQGAAMKTKIENPLGYCITPTADGRWELWCKDVYLSVYLNKADALEALRWCPEQFQIERG